MAESKTKGVTDYIANFNSTAYLENWTLGASRSTAYHEEFNSLVATLHHHIFSALQPGERLLDVGSGPGIKNVMSASAKYQNITLSDPVQQNRHMLQKYMDDVTEDQRWTEHFKLTAELEGDAQKWPEVRDRMRARIKHVVWCDILQDEPLGKDQPEDLFDCVVATLALSGACTEGDASTYARAVKNLVSLAKPGGLVIIADVFSENYYYIGNTKLLSYDAPKNQVQEYIEAAGCVSITSKSFVMKHQFVYKQPPIIFILAARKPFAT